MKKLLVTLLVLAIYYVVSAQVPDSKPVKFTFQVVRLNDTSAYLSVNAKMIKEVKLFPAIKGGTDNPFQSSLTLTGSPKVYIKTTDTSTAIGNSQLIKGSDGKESQVFADSVNFHFPLHITKDSALVKGSFVWLGIKGDEYPNGEESFSVQLPPVLSQAVLLTKTKSADKSLWSIFLLTFGAGLIAVITPCVFPLVPVTVSFFLKRSKSRLEGIRNAVWYSISIISIYTIPTLILTLVFGDKILYTISTSAISNLLFFAIFIIFAISFFGAFELTLPNSWANKADQQAGKGGLGGIFFMALTLVIVSFSCTGPIVGTLLGQTSTNGVSAAPVIGMLGFGVGLALPFSLFAFSLLCYIPCRKAVDG
jgi:cytochrome c biogenesis protein CcdA